MLTQPDKDGKIPEITLASGITGSDGKPLAGADVTFPVALALMGQQFAGTEADLGMTMNVSASTLDETKGQQSGTATGEGKFGIAGLSVTVKVSASFSEIGGPQAGQRLPGDHHGQRQDGPRADA